MAIDKQKDMKPYPVDKCFTCHEVFDSEDEVVYWMGTEMIALHPPCAVKLATRLIYDTGRLAGREARGATHGKYLDDTP